MRFKNVPSLCAFIAAHQKNDEVHAIATKINSISWPPVNLKLINPLPNRSPLAGVPFGNFAHRRVFVHPVVVPHAAIRQHSHEHEADQIFRRNLAQLFKNESNHPLEVMKWRDILESTETATDRAEDVADIIEGIVLEHA